ncbi:MAG: hypothetical protein M3255_07755, partial [Pseudomonadota bacterium]|nr:hypothetical protein [Pseudomonadota bacterium]
MLLLLDGLYPNGPLMALCHHYGWHFMIVLPERCLPWVWEEVEALKPRQPHHRHSQTWRGRQQQLWWVNDITYGYDNARYELVVQVVGCEETWQAVDPDSGELIDKQARHVWLSSHRLQHDNIPPHCNLPARQRLWYRGQYAGREAPGLLLRACLLPQLECPAGLPFSDALG